MELSEFINAYPRRQRTQLRQQLAAAHGVAESTVRSWANGHRNHPAGLTAMQITECFSGGRVTRYDLRHDVFGESSRQS